MEEKNTPKNLSSFGGYALLSRRLRVLIYFRVLFVTLLLGSFSLFNIGYHRTSFPQAFSYLIGSLYILSIVYFVLLRRVRNLYLFAYVQLIIDAIAEIVLIYLTGGIESWFTSIMFLTVLSSPVVLHKHAGYTIATLLSILYGSMLDLQYYGVINLSYEVALREKDFLYNIFTHITALYLTAYLAGYLVTRLEKTTKKLEEKDLDLQDLTIFNRELIESLPSGLLTTDREGQIVIFNRAAEIITGRQRSQVIGRNITELFPSLTFHLPALPNFSSSELPGEYHKSHRLETKIKYNEVEKIVGLNLSEIINVDGIKTGYICIFQDITHIKKLEAELNYKRTLAAIGELSANMAHEIRNPLASLKGAIEMLKEDRLLNDQREKLMNIAINEMDRLNKIIIDFLMYSRPSPPQFVTFDLHELLADTIDMLGMSSLNSEAIKIRKDFSGNLPITGDPQKLRQVFLNLMNNSVEAMINGGEIKISTRIKDKGVEILFEDSGPGIAPENIEKIFYPFFTTKDKGTGLGLSIVYRIIQEHGGSIRVHSTSGEGTIFKIELPLHREQPFSVSLSNH